MVGVVRGRDHQGGREDPVRSYAWDDGVTSAGDEPARTLWRLRTQEEVRADPERRRMVSEEEGDRDGDG